MSKLSVVATPIGNMEDITIRAIKTLLTVDAILAEDTRHTGLLMAEIIRRWGEQFDVNPDWKPVLIPYYDEIEEKQLPELIQRLTEGQHLALVSDAGTPLISDPGYRIVHECIKRNIKVESIPGPSALIAALTASGMPADKFTFLGYLPDKTAARLKLLTQCVANGKTVPVTYICYCAPHKLAQTLTDLDSVLGDTQMMVARELTKIHEETWKGTPKEAMKYFENPKGEFVLLFRPS